MPTAPLQLHTSPSPTTPTTSISSPLFHLQFRASTNANLDLPLPRSKSRRRFQQQQLYHHIQAQASLSQPSSCSSPSSTPDIPPSADGGFAATDVTLLSLLRQRKTEEAYELYSRCSNIPGSSCVSRLLAQLAYQRSPTALSRAQSLVQRLRDCNLLHRLDANSLGLLAVAAAKSGDSPYALSIIRSMLRSGYLPHVKAWSSVVSTLSADGDPDNSAAALRLFNSVLRKIIAADSPITANSCPDTAAFNAALNAASNLGTAAVFAQLWDKMPAYNAKPDVLTYNILIKLCARSDRKDLLVFVLERIILSGLVPCITTFHSLVAAYVGLDDLSTAEKLVQAMREGRLDVCRLLRAENSKSLSIDNTSNEEEADLTLDKLAAVGSDEPPLLPRTYTPDARIYTTLMKGYMKTGHSDNVVRMIAAMKLEQDPASHPDIVTYTTAITALANSGAMDRARNLLDEMSRAGVPPNRVTYNVLLKGYCAKLQIDKAKELIRAMPAGIEPDVFSYNILIDGCILVDDSTSALAFFNEMRERGIPPSQVSYTTLMKAFVETGQPKLAHKVFDEMEKDPRVKVDRVAFNMLVEAYSRFGLVEEAKKVVGRMKEKGFSPDVATYGSLANGIAVARKPGEALLLWKEVKERWTGEGSGGGEAGGEKGFRPDEGLLDALADVCVRAAFFRKALEIVACMEENGISPNKTKYKRIYVEMHGRMFTSKHASLARQARRHDRKRAAEAFKFWLGLPNSYYGSEWRLEPLDGCGDEFGAGR